MIFVVPTGAARRCAPLTFRWSMERPLHEVEPASQNSGQRASTSSRRSVTRVSTPASSMAWRICSSVKYAGSGTFTGALVALVGPTGRVHAVERDARRVRTLRELARESSTIEVVEGDFTLELALPRLDGVMLANALHFVPAEGQAALLARLAAMLRPGGGLVVVEYEDRVASRWVPHPVSSARLAKLAHEAGLPAPREIGRRASRYGGSMYAAEIRLVGNPAS